MNRTESGYELLVLDIDGTLTNSKKEITPRTKEVLMRIQKAGKRLVIASGRPTAGILSIADELHLDEYNGFILAFNGGRIINYTTGEIVYNRTIPLELLPEIYRYSKELGTGILTYTESEIVLGNEPDQYCELESRICKIPIRQVEDFVKFVDFPINKFLMTGEPELIFKAQSVMREKFGWVLNIFRSEPFYLEIVPQSIDKANSLARLLEHLGMKREQMICCGDGFNDRSMIEFAGVGVAMENAQEEVKAAADYITASNDKDGIVEVVEKFILS